MVRLCDSHQCKFRATAKCPGTGRKTAIWGVLRHCYDQREAPLRVAHISGPKCPPYLIKEHVEVKRLGNERRRASISKGFFDSRLMLVG